MLTIEVLEDFRYIVVFGPTREAAREMLCEAKNDACHLGWDVEKRGGDYFILTTERAFMPSRWKVRMAYPGIKMCSLKFDGMRPQICLYRGKPKVKVGEEANRFYNWFLKAFYPAFSSQGSRFYPV